MITDKDWAGAHKQFEIALDKIVELQHGLENAKNRISELQSVSSHAVESLYAAYMQFMPIAGHESEMDMVMDAVKEFRNIVSCPEKVSE